MSDLKHDPGTVHVYSPQDSFADAIIAGDAAGLTALRDALNQALAGGTASSSVLNAADVRYSIVVVQHTKERMHSTVMPHIRNAARIAQVRDPSPTP